MRTLLVFFGDHIGTKRAGRGPPSEYHAAFSFTLNKSASSNASYELCFRHFFGKEASVCPCHRPDETLINVILLNSLMRYHIS